ncbi:MAG: hypothetical protein ACPL88_11205, partial [Bryobacteraceae bacterium]
PCGLAQLERRRPAAVRWAWTLNAAASVLGSVGAVALGLYAGLRETLLIGGLMYAGACGMARRWRAIMPVSSGALSHAAAGSDVAH